MPIPTFSPSPWRLKSVAAYAVLCLNNVSNNPFGTLLSLPPSRVQYTIWGNYFSTSPLWESEKEPSKPPFPFCWVRHCQRCPTHYAWSCTPVSLLPPSTLYWISTSVLILRQPNNPAYIFLLPSYSQYATFILLLYKSPYISTPISASVLVCLPCHIAFLLPLYLSTWFSPVFFQLLSSPSC